MEGRYYYTFRYTFHCITLSIKHKRILWPVVRNVDSAIHRIVGIQLLQKGTGDIEHVRDKK